MRSENFLRSEQLKGWWDHLSVYGRVHFLLWLLSYKGNMTDDMRPQARVMMDTMDELSRATAKFGPFVSPHEGIAIIEEEFLELRDAVFHKLPGEHPEERRLRVRKEAIQVAAMAMRFVIDISDSERPFDGTLRKDSQHGAGT